MNAVFHPNKKNRLARAAALGAVPVLALGLVGCSNDTAGPESGADVEDVQELDEDEDPGTVEEEVTDVYDGLYDANFYDNYDEYEGEEVTVSAKVNEVLSPEVFTIAGTEDTTVDALPILHTDPLDDLAADVDVQVTGIAEVAFDIAAIEEDKGIDLDDELFEEWDGQPYIDASTVDTTVSLDD